MSIISLGEKSTYHFSQIEDVAKKLFVYMKSAHVITFTGPLGAGKTALVRCMLRLYGVTGPITSPTFAYVNTYSGAKDITLHHFDLYRLQTVGEFLQMGFDEYLYQNNSKAFIEWPNIVMPLLNRSVYHVSLEYGDDSEYRSITVLCTKDLLLKGAHRGGEQ